MIGDVDVLINNSGQAPTLLRNEAKSGNWLQLKLVGTRSNRDAVGAKGRPWSPRMAVKPARFGAAEAICPPAIHVFILGWAVRPR